MGPAGPPGLAPASPAYWDSSLRQAASMGSPQSLAREDSVAGVQPCHRLFIRLPAVLQCNRQRMQEKAPGLLNNAKLNVLKPQPGVGSHWTGVTYMDMPLAPP
jgi:hypothetical protein